MKVTTTITLIYLMASTLLAQNNPEEILTSFDQYQFDESINDFNLRSSLSYNYDEEYYKIADTYSSSQGDSIKTSYMINGNEYVITKYIFNSMDQAWRWSITIKETKDINEHLVVRSETSSSISDVTILSVYTRNYSYNDIGLLEKEELIYYNTADNIPILKEEHHYTYNADMQVASIISNIYGNNNIRTNTTNSYFDNQLVNATVSIFDETNQTWSVDKIYEYTYPNNETQVSKLYKVINGNTTQISYNEYSMQKEVVANSTYFELDANGAMTLGFRSTVTRDVDENLTQINYEEVDATTGTFIPSAKDIYKYDMETGIDKVVAPYYYEYFGYDAGLGKNFNKKLLDITRYVYKNSDYVIKSKTVLNYKDVVQSGPTDAKHVTVQKAAIYPNPSNDYVIFAPEDLASQVIISDMAGRVYTSEILNSDSMNISKLPNGIYTIFIIRNNTKKNAKLVVQH